MKSGTALERLTAVDTVVFDKTGTLTPGPADAGRTGRATIARPWEAAAALAGTSRHPLGAARGPGRAGRRHRPTGWPRSGRGGPGEGGRRRRDPPGQRRLLGVDPPRRPGGLRPPRPELWLARPGAAPVAVPFRSSYAARVRMRSPWWLGLEGRADWRSKLLFRRPAGRWSDGGGRGAVGYRALAGRDPSAGQGSPGWMRWPARRANRADGRDRPQRRSGPGLRRRSPCRPHTGGRTSPQTGADAVFPGRRAGAVGRDPRGGGRADRLVRPNFVLAFGYNVFTVPLAMAGFVTPLIARRGDVEVRRSWWSAMPAPSPAGDRSGSKSRRARPRRPPPPGGSRAPAPWTAERGRSARRVLPP